MRQYFESVITGLEQKIAASPEGTTPRRLYVLETAKLGRRLFSGTDRVAWCGVLVPFELLNALGVNSCFVEFVGASLAASGMVGSFLERAENEGFAPDTCAYHRGVMGAAFQGLMPQPDVLIATSAPCSAGVSTMENLAQHFGKELFVLHIPPTATPDRVTHVAGQLREMVEFVTAHTGARLDREVLREAMVLSNRARELLVEVYGLAQSIPSPVTSHDLRDLGIVLSLFFGTEVAVTIAQAYRDELARRVEAGQSGVPDERIRLMWVQNRIQFRNPLERMMAEDHGAVIVIDELNSVTWDPIDPEDPWEGLARRMAGAPLCSPLEHRVRHLRKLAREYRVDGAIHPCHWGCRQGTGARGPIQQGLKELGVPMLDLGVDCVDSRAFSEGQVRTRVGAFLEMLGARPSPWR